MSEEDKISYLNDFIKVIPYYGEFAPPYNRDLLDAQSAVIGYPHPDLAKLDEALEVIQYMVHYGFAMFLHGIDTGSIVYAQLTDRGRKLKELGTVEKFNRWSLLEQSEAQFRIKMVEYNYWIAVSIALSTFVAAVYYFFQLRDGSTKPHKDVASITLGICVGAIALLAALRYLPRFARKKS